MPLVCQNCGHSTSWDTALVPDTVNTIPAANDFAIAAASHRAALAEIQAEITRFKTYSANYISALERKQADVKAKLKAIVYPVLSLPPEITSRIFVECLPEYASASMLRDAPVPALSGCAPVLLMRVCRTWRDIALSTPTLWSSLCIESNSHHEIMVRRGTLAGLETWFSRARELPLSLTINYFSRSGFLDRDQLDLSSFLPRLGRLDTSLPDADIKDIMKNAPLLVELRWWLRSPRDVDLDGFTSNALRTLCIDSLDPFSPSEFITVLQNLPSLSDLTCMVKPDPDYRRTPLTFPNLSSLFLLAHYGDPPIPILELLTLPNLGALKCNSPLQPDVVIPFLSRSKCVIRELECDFRRDFDRYPGNISHNLENFPAVQTLKIGVYFIHSFLADLGLEPDPDAEGAHPSAAPLLAPKLQHLTIICDREFGPADCRRLINFVERRRVRSDTAPLKSLHVSSMAPSGSLFGNIVPFGRCPQCPGDRIIADFRSLTEGGLDFKIEGSLEWSVT